MSKPAGLGVRHSATFLGVAGLLEYGLHLVLPIILVRALPQDAFGDYRLVLLLASTTMAILPFGMPLSLFHFLPQAGPGERPRLVGNVWLFVTLSGLAIGAVLSLGWSWLPDSIAGLERYSILAPLFLALWIMGSVLDVLPTADGNARWQAGAVAGLAIFRTTSLGLAAVLTHDATFVLIALCAYGLLKVLLVPIYALTGATQPGLAIHGPLLKQQIRYAFPFALGNAFFLLRVQADQWIVATHFPPSVFALISIAAIVMSVSTLVRQPLNNATLPRLSSLLGQGQREAARELLAKAYSMLGLMLLPALGLLFVAAYEVVEIIYTPAYLGAAALMQLYLIGQMTGVFAAGHLLVVLKAGRLATTISAVCLVLAVVLSLIGVRTFGLPGAVVGSVISLVVGEVWALIATTRLLGTTVRGVTNWSVTGRAVLVVVVAVTAAWAARRMTFSQFDLWPRLIATTMTYVTTLGLTAFMTGLHRLALPLIRGFPKRSGP